MAKAVATLDLNAAGFQRGIDQATKQLASFGAAVAGIGAAGLLAGVATAAASVAVAASGMKRSLDIGGTLSDISAQTGIAVRDLVVLRQAFQNAGLGADAVGPAVARLQKALAGANEDGEDTTGIFSKLGLDIRSLSKLRPDQQFEAVGRAIASIDSPAQRTAAAMAIFGRSGAQMLSLFRDASAIANARAEVGGLADVMDRSANRFDAMSDQIATILDVKQMQVFSAMAEQLAPKIENALQTLSRVDLSGIGTAISMELSKAFEGQPIAKAISELNGKMLSVFAAAAAGIGEVLAGAIMKGYEGPITWLQAKIEEITERIANMFSDQGALDFQVLANNRLAEMARKFGMPGLADQYDAESEKLIKENYRPLPDDLTTQERMDRIRADGGPRFGLGDGRTAEQLTQSGIDRVSAAVNQAFPQMAAAIQAEVGKVRAESGPLSDGPVAQPRPRGTINGEAPPETRFRGVLDANGLPLGKSPFSAGAGFGGIGEAFQKQIAEMVSGSRAAASVEQSEQRRRTEIIQSEMQRQTEIIKAAIGIPRVIEVVPIIN